MSRHPSPDPAGTPPVAAPERGPGDEVSPAPNGQSRDAPGYGAAFRAVTAVSLVFAYLLVVLGDTVRVTESGMGCRSWPLCNGTIALTGNYHALLEQSHRYLAAGVTVLVITTFAMAWRRARNDRVVMWSAGAALGLIGVQVLLGAITVFAHNAGWTVALHLAGAWLVVGAVTLTVMGAWRPAAAASPGPRAARDARLGVAAVVALLALSVSGMLVLHDGASNACPGWPACGLSGSATLLSLQYLHRSLALIAAVFITAAAVCGWRCRRARPAAGVLAVAALVFLAVTVTFGALVATSGAPPTEQDFHLAVGSALWIAVVALASLLGPATAAIPARTRSS